MRRAETEADPVEAARDYLQRGWAIMPIPYGEKAPRIANRTNLRRGEKGLLGLLTVQVKTNRRPSPAEGERVAPKFFVHFVESREFPATRHDLL